MEMEYVWVTEAGKNWGRKTVSQCCAKSLTSLHTVVPSSNYLTLWTDRATVVSDILDTLSCFILFWICFFDLVNISFSFVNTSFYVKAFFCLFSRCCVLFYVPHFPPLGAFKLSAEMLGSMLQQCHYAIIMGLFWSFNKHLCPRCTGDILSVPEITSVSLCFSQCWSVCSKVQQRIIMAVWHEKSLSSLNILDWYSLVVNVLWKGECRLYSQSHWCSRWRFPEKF